MTAVKESRDMNLPNKFLFVVFLFGSIGMYSACTAKTQEQVADIAEDVKDKTRDVGEEAAENKREIAGKIADKGREVVSATGEAITDSWITTKLKAKFSDEKLLKGSSIKVETANRTVTLKGTVASEAAKARAASVAMGTEGVERVDNQLVASPN
jgi:hyperosmotically inducible protein